jgi:hypothetical protein
MLVLNLVAIACAERESGAHSKQTLHSIKQLNHLLGAEHCS